MTLDKATLGLTDCCKAQRVANSKEQGCPEMPLETKACGGSMDKNWMLIQC